jgi:hypothetical protein
VFGAFVSVALIRIIGLLAEQREAAEHAVRVSGERFRALVQDACDVVKRRGAHSHLTDAPA